MSKLALFDLDGTLLRTQGAGMRAMADAGARLWGEAFHFEGLLAAGSLDSVLFRSAAQRCGVAITDENQQRFMEAYHAALTEELRDKQFEPLPGVMSLLEELRRHPRITLGLLTGNYRLTTPVKLQTAGIDPRQFRVTAFGDDGHCREDLVEVAIRRYAELHGRRAAAHEVVVIGDTPRDVECAKAHGCLALAVATGPYTVEDLRKTAADVVLQDLSDSTAFWALLGERR